MEARKVVRQIEKQGILALDEQDLRMLLAAADLIRADDTCLAGPIRILSLGGHILVQEQTLDGEVLLRRLGSTEAAQQFVEDRLADYERMWDGCGCKIDYRQPSENE